MRNIIWLSTPHPGHDSYGIQFDSPKKDEIVAFLYVYLKDKEQDFFLQGNSGSWAYFEFFTSKNKSEVQDFIIDTIAMLVEKFGLEYVDESDLTEIFKQT